MKMIEPGAYQLPEGCTCVKKGDTIEIRPSKKLPKYEHHCCDCKHFSWGMCTDGLYKSNICLKKPKNRFHYKYKEPLYYAAYPDHNICEMFEPK